jgi:hypothetical protein
MCRSFRRVESQRGVLYSQKIGNQLPGVYESYLNLRTEKNGKLENDHVGLFRSRPWVTL